MKNNGSKVTLAVLAVKIDNLKEDVVDIKKQNQRYFDKVDTLDKEQGKIKERQTIWNYGLTIFNVIVGAIVATFGGKGK